MAAELKAEGYEIIPATFTEAFGPNGETMSFNGTIQEVMDQVHDINPDYKFETEDAKVDGDDDEDVDDDGGLVKRDWRDRTVTKKKCDIGDWARKYFIDDGVKYLRGLKKSKCKLRSKGCSRVSCSWGSAIWVCWHPHKNSPKTYTKSWGYVADYADGIAAGDWCPREHRPQDPYTRYRVKGKVWNPRGMAVRIGSDKC